MHGIVFAQMDKSNYKCCLPSLGLDLLRECLELVALGIIGWELIVLTKKKKKEKFDE